MAAAWLDDDYSLVVSFSNYNLASNRIRPAGLSNYANLIEDPKVVTSLKNTLFYAVTAVPLEVALALVLALLLNQVGREPARSGPCTTCRR